MNVKNAGLLIAAGQLANGNTSVVFSSSFLNHDQLEVPINGFLPDPENSF